MECKAAVVRGFGVRGQLETSETVACGAACRSSCAEARARYVQRKYLGWPFLQLSVHSVPVEDGYDARVAAGENGESIMTAT